MAITRRTFIKFLGLIPLLSIACRLSDKPINELSHVISSSSSITITGTSAVKHYLGDLYVNMNTNVLYRYNGTNWDVVL